MRVVRETRELQGQWRRRQQAALVQLVNDHPWQCLDQGAKLTKRILLSYLANCPVQLGGLGALARSRPLAPAEQCRTVLAYQQLCFSLAAPALVAAVVETRLWLRHQAERRQHGLPSEGGWQQRLYWALQAVLLGHDWAHVAVLSWLLSGVLHLAAVALSVDA